ncbi:MAG TPA: transcription-repair coupling factor [Nitrospiraceae bacterium]|jgi:transcription-repair coupling factor (superfamily II helicase)|nr:transcription-repair coupling factor [Nitrospiraceae bacterium]
MNIPAIFSNFSTQIPSDASRVCNLSGSSAALYLCLRREPFVAIERTEDGALRLYEDMAFFRSLGKDIVNQPGSTLFFPDPNGPETSGKRAQVISVIDDTNSLVTSVRGIQSPVWSREDLRRDSLVFVKGEEVNREAIGGRLGALGYRRVSIVVEKGEYCIKGWLLDIFPSTTEDPVRIEFFGDEIETMKTFDLDSQKSLGQIVNLAILPAGEPSSGREVTSLIHVKQFLVDAATEAERDGLSEKLLSFATPVSLSRFDFQGEGFDAGLRSLRGCGIYPEERESFDDLVSAVNELSRANEVIIVSSSKGQAERVREIFFARGLIAPIIEAGEVADYQGHVVITPGRLSSGFFMKGLLILTEKEIFGERPSYRPLRKSRVSKLLTTIDDISPGDLVVHEDHGIGKFIDILRQNNGDYQGDLIVVEYVAGDRLYIPLYNVNRIKKYSAEEGVLPHLDRLGGKSWQRTKERVRKAVKEMAERLLKLYAEREVAEGFAFSRDTELHKEFYGFFPYEETPDQVTAIEEIGRDMESDRPMERLLCGDVGYGKTEVAMRAAFKAVYDGKQVAVLVPTTILCEQHYLTFTSRFSAFPVRIDYLSRFKAKREQALTLRAVEKGEVDIIIGTHGLLKKGVSFDNLGLLIIDEEHRFGVKQKEKIKELKKGVDVLIMTATPIPRTLQMALSGIRGMSLIETPPEERLAVRSIVCLYDADLLREAIGRELQRGGQILFVHNMIFDIERVTDQLKRLLPHAKIDVAHGQMPERRLEEVMHSFFKGDLDVLVSTNIIGAGIDIPTANTIIIDRADKMGLADLYQLRGRVGRSNVRAYAYFLVPGEDLMTHEAKKRLQAVREMSFLGAGFRLAMKDLEIRGAGNFLGPQQSGHIHAVGFDMYVEMLEKAVAELKGGEAKAEIEPSLHFRVAARIPEEYVEDLTIRLSIYRRVATAKSAEDLDNIETEMADRFGSLPEEVKRLLDIMRLKIMARTLCITQISEADGKVRFVFSDETSVGADKIFGLRDNLRGIHFQRDGFELGIKGLSPRKEPLEAVRDVLKQLLN